MCREINSLKSPIRVLFIGNSATYVNDLPGTLSRLAQKAGYNLECDRSVKGDARLSQHADRTEEQGEATWCAIRKGFDIVFIQDHGNCVANDERREASILACETLGAAIRETGARVGIYVRPPYGYEKWGNDPFEQCRAFDAHFAGVAASLDAISAYVNRAFAYAIKHTDFRLWGRDNAHTSEHGAYLAVCVFFATIFGTSSSVLESNGLSDTDAHALQSIADKIALDGVLPW